MKYYLLLILSLFVLDSKGQDSASHLNRGSISVTGGANVTYPNGSWVPGGCYGGKPIGSAGLWFSLSDNFIFLHTNHVSLGLKLGIGVVQYAYMAKFAEEITYGPPTVVQKINAITFSPDIFSNITISKTIGWYTELGLSGEAVVYYQYNPNAGGDGEGYQPPLNFTNENEFNLYLYYSTGISINLNKNITIVPLIAFPLLNFTTLFPQSTSYVNIYNDFRTGIMITYNFTKK